MSGGLLFITPSEAFLQVGKVFWWVMNFMLKISIFTSWEFFFQIEYFCSHCHLWIPCLPRWLVRHWQTFCLLVSKKRLWHLQVGRCKPYNLLQWSSNIPRSTQTSITNKSYQCNLISRPAKTSITNRSFQLQQWTEIFLLQFYEMLQQKSFHKRQVSAFWAPCVYLGSFCEDYLGNIWRLFDIY